MTEVPQKNPVRAELASDLSALQRAEKAGSLVMAARVHSRKGRRDEARAALREALKLMPTDAGALELLGDMFLEEGEQNKAIAVFQKGLEHHPKHLAFEEKIAIAKLDLAEMESDKIRRQLFLEQGDTEKWRDKNPGLAASLSVVLPGAGQFYSDEYERGAVFLGVAIVSFAAWFWPLTSAMARVTEAIPSGSQVAMGEVASRAFADMGSFGKSFIYLMILVWLLTYVVSAWDAARGVNAAIEARKRGLGIE
ncbi:MAG TPA: tetratricopeptide repeat protein [Abditibacteriaceae bacterium]|jgi:tetratricopeptide (TPR) repeat protein